MKKIILPLAVLFTLTTNATFAQYAETEKPAKKRELGIRFTGLNDFNFQYKLERKENKYFRFDVGQIFLSSRDLEGTFDARAGLNFSFGLEKRKPITDKLSFYHGLNFGINYLTEFGNSRPYHLVSPRVGYTLGALYEINDRFNLSIETTPSISSSFLFGGGNIANRSYFDLRGNNKVGISLLYKFKK